MTGKAPELQQNKDTRRPPNISNYRIPRKTQHSPEMELLSGLSKPSCMCQYRPERTKPR